MQAMLKSALKRVLPAAVWNQARLWQYKRTISRFPERNVRHSYNGFTFDVWISDPTAESWEDLDIPPLEEIAFLGKRRLKPGARVFDIGAHQCVIAMILAKTVSPGGGGGGSSRLRPILITREWANVTAFPTGSTI